MSVRTFDGIYCDACVGGSHLVCAERLAIQAGAPPTPDTVCACSCDLTCPRMGVGDARLYPASVGPTVQRARDLAIAQAAGAPKPDRVPPPDEHPSGPAPRRRG